jgi:exopolyphosphatase / guanosine-5'-triphosphate,3'-diphosphate pyrophosphatase
VTVTVAVIDVGSHTVRLLVAGEKDGTIAPVREAKRVLGLGVEVEREGLISEEKLEQVASCVRSFARIARKLGSSRLETVVTAPGRQSENGAELVEALVAAVGGGPVRVLTPDEEGELAFYGALEGAGALPEPLAVCDVGGGSTEVVVGTRSDGPGWVRSVDIGAVRLTGRLLAEDPSRDTALTAARAEVDSELEPFIPPPLQSALATGGTARALRKLAGPRLGREELEDSLLLLGRRSSSRIAKSFGIDQERARTLPAGALILAAVQERLGVPLTVSRTGLREGAVRMMLAEAEAAA